MKGATIMSLPRITPQHIQQALDELMNTPSSNLSPSTSYDVLYKGRRFPPKEVIRRAHQFAMGLESFNITLSGGDHTNNILIRNGYTVVLKNDTEPLPLNYRKGLREAKGVILEQPAPTPSIDFTTLTETEKEIIGKRRVGQSEFKQQLLNRHKGCVICSIQQRELLIASHIKPWRDCTSTERLDVNNGLLLCALHDALFDKGLISFTPEGDILYSSELRKEEVERCNFPPSFVLPLNHLQRTYMEWHRQRIFKR